MRDLDLIQKKLLNTLGQEQSSGPTGRGRKEFDVSPPRELRPRVVESDSTPAQALVSADNPILRASEEGGVDVGASNVFERNLYKKEEAEQKEQTQEVSGFM